MTGMFIDSGLYNLYTGHNKYRLSIELPIECYGWGGYGWFMPVDKVVRNGL
jgi:hypothetical protein